MNGVVEEEKVICVDFDGVIHNMKKWIAPHIMDGEPVDGAIDWLTDAVDKFDVVIIHTSRLYECSSNPTKNGMLYKSDVSFERRITAMKDWLFSNGCLFEVISQLRWHVSGGKPYANVYLDDRAVRFEGTFPKVESLLEIRPWSER